MFFESTFHQLGRARFITHLVLALCFNHSLSLAAQTCSTLTGDDKTAVVTYMKRQLEVPDNAVVVITSVESVGNTCYRRLQIKGLSINGNLIAYMSPDKRYLTSNLADLTTDPRELKKKFRLETEAKLAAVASSIGDTEPAVIITEFIDYECPYCRQFTTWLDALPSELRSQVALRYINMPLPMHPWAHSAALYALCIAIRKGDLGQFQKTLFRDQTEITEERLRKIEESLFPAQPTALTTCYSDASTNTRLNEQLELAKELNVEGTPAFFLNGRQVSIQSKDELATVVQAGLKAALEKAPDLESAHTGSQAKP